MYMEYWRISHCYDSRMVQHHYLSGKFGCNCWRCVDMPKNISSCYVFLLDAPYVEAYVVSRLCLLHLLMVHLDCLYFACYPFSFSCWDKYDLVSYFHYTRLYSTYRNNSDTSDVINIL